MIMALRILSVLSCSILICLALGMRCVGQDAQTLLLEKPVDLDLKKSSLALVLGHLSVHQDIPIGFVARSEEKYELLLNVKVHGAPLKEVLDLIVKQEPRYIWEIRDGVVNITPVGRTDEFFERLLTTRIKRFAPRPGSTKYEVKEAVLDLPEVKALLNEKGITASKLMAFHRPSIYANSVDLSCSDTDLLTILNKIARESEFNFWSLDWADNEHKELEFGL